MDVSLLIAASSSKSRSIEVVKEVPLHVDAGLLAVFDSNELDEEAYRADTEAYLQATARDGVQALINGLFALPIQKSGDGPLAMLPSIETPLPRAKPLPKPKAPTKWEQFAAAKGIQKKRREKKIWDEEKQEWVDRWGRGAKNKQVEEQWAVEVPANAPNDYDPFKEARDERKARVAKNEKQRLSNAARSQGTSTTALKEERKTQLNRQIAQSRTSTASMGRFDRKLEGEPKTQGVKRKFEPNERSADEERKASLAIASKLDREGGNAKKSRKGSTDGGGDGVLNVRKAIRNVSGGGGGRGALALTQGNGKRGGRRGQAAPRGKGKR